MELKKTAILLFAILTLSPCTPSMGAPYRQSSPQLSVKAAAHLQIPFIENRGQVADPAVAYVANTFACQVAVSRDGRITYSRSRGKKGDVPMSFEERLVGTEVAIAVKGRDQRTTKINYYRSADPSQWQSGLPTYSRVSLGRVAPGIRMALKAQGDNVEKLFYLSPGADPARIRLAVEGAQSLTARADGALELSGPSGKMAFTRPVAYQDIDGKRREVDVSYRVSQNTYGFELGTYDRSRPLVIDPLVKVFSIQGDDGNFSVDIAFTDAVADQDTGNIYAAGYAFGELVIYKMDSRLENILAEAHFSRFAKYDGNVIHAIELDSQGNVFIAGTTDDRQFPITPGCWDDRPTYGSTFLAEGFITKFSSELEIMASTFIGGDHIDRIFDMAIDKKNDKVYVTGYAEYHHGASEQVYPATKGAYDTFTAETSVPKAVVSRLDNDLTTLEAGTYLGGTRHDHGLTFFDKGHDVAIDPQGNVWVTGTTTQPDFPVTEGCVGPTHNGDIDVFVSKFDPDLTQLLASTYLGGSKREAPREMIFDSQGNLFLVGYTESKTFPMPEGGYQSTHTGFEEDGFILKISPGIDQLLAGTFIGGERVDDDLNNGDDVPAAMAFSADEKELVVVGRTESRAFPLTPDHIDNVNEEWSSRSPTSTESSRPVRDHSRGGDFGSHDYGDGFVTKLTSDLSQLTYSTFIGGHLVEYFDAVLINGEDIIVAGESQSGHSTFPLIVDNNKMNVLWHKAVLLRITTDGTPTDPNDPNTPNITATGGGGGGGGCFLWSIKQ